MPTQGLCRLMLPDTATEEPDTMRLYTKAENASRETRLSSWSPSLTSRLQPIIILLRRIGDMLDKMSR